MWGSCMTYPPGPAKFLQLDIIPARASSETLDPIFTP